MEWRCHSCHRAHGHDDDDDNVLIILTIMLVTMMLMVSVSDVIWMISPSQLVVEISLQF